MEVARVFPRKTELSPIDELSFFGSPPEKLPKIDEVHISVLLTYDIEKAERLKKEWEKIALVKIGGPALKAKGEIFVPGQYVKHGGVMTSRGCPNKCWFCSVWKREGDIRELPILNGFNVLDSNILAYSKDHIIKVFDMLKQQKERAHFTGGLEAKIMTDWHVSMLWDLKPKQMFFAYDEKDDLDPLIVAGEKLRYANFTRSHLRCYVLIGFRGDTIEKAKIRLIEAWSAGFLPFAMLWRNEEGEVNKDWEKFQRLWARPAIIKSVMMEDYKLNHNKQ